MRYLKIILWIALAFTIILGFVLAFFIPRTSAASTNINPATPHFFAWNDVMGWIDFYSSQTVVVDDRSLHGYAHSSLGSIALDCASSPHPDCTINYGICNGFGAHETTGSCSGINHIGTLTGYAWNDAIGWISFSSTNHNGTIPYQVSLNLNSGIFSGWAWNDIVGWISFNSTNHPGSVLYDLSTSWRPTGGTYAFAYLESATFDTKVQKGAILNSIIWQGEESTSIDGGVDFQIAASQIPNPSSWDFKGPGGDPSLYYAQPCPAIGPSLTGGGAPPYKPICVDPTQVTNFRYFRYKVRLKSDISHTYTPHVKEVILNWSP